MLRDHPALAEIADQHRRVWTDAVTAIGEGQTALVVSSGGAIELGLVACLPVGDHDTWGQPVSHCDGARPSYRNGEFTGLTWRRVSH